MKNAVTALGISELRQLIENMSNGKDKIYLGIAGMDVTADAHKENKPPREYPAMRRGCTSIKPYFSNKYGKASSSKKRKYILFHIVCILVIVFLWKKRRMKPVYVTHAFYYYENKNFICV